MFHQRVSSLPHVATTLSQVCHKTETSSENLSVFFSGDSKKKPTFRTHKSLAQKAIDAAQKSRSQSSPALLLPIQPLGKSLHSSI